MCLKILRMGIFSISQKLIVASGGTLYVANNLKLYRSLVISETLQFRAMGVTLTPNFLKRQKSVIFLSLHPGRPHIDTKYQAIHMYHCYYTPSIESE